MSILKPFKNISSLSQASTYPTLWLVRGWVQTLRDHITGMNLALPPGKMKTVTGLFLANLDQYFNELNDPQGVYMKTSFLSLKMTGITRENKKILLKSLAREYLSMTPSPYEANLPEFLKKKNT